MRELKRIQTEIAPFVERIELYVESCNKQLSAVGSDAERVRLYLDLARASHDPYIGNELIEQGLILARQAGLSDLEAKAASYKAAVAKVFELTDEFRHHVAMVRKLTQNTSVLEALEKLDSGVPDPETDEDQ